MAKQIKLDLDGELLEVLLEISEEECRSCTQQVLYILKTYLKDEIKELRMRKSGTISPKVIETHEEGEKLTKGDNDEVIIEKDDTNTIEIVEKNEDPIDDEILDFFS